MSIESQFKVYFAFWLTLANKQSKQCKCIKRLIHKNDRALLMNNADTKCLISESDDAKSALSNYLWC